MVESGAESPSRPQFEEILRVAEEQASLVIRNASIQGDRQTLTVDAVIPAVMALIYLGLLIYFRSIGGYKAVHLEGAE